MSVGAQVHVGNGGTFDRDGLSFAGFDMLPADADEPAEVIVSVCRHDTDSAHFRLSLGQSFDFAGQTWRLDEIDDASHAGTRPSPRVA